MDIPSASVSPTQTRVTVGNLPLRQNVPKEDNEEGRKNTQEPDEKALTAAEQKQLRELKARDREVRAHEAAHLIAAGTLAIRGANYTYQRGPDGVQYAVDREVSIDNSPVPGDPEATLDKAQQIRKAALAPAQPSQQDIAVANKATQLAIEARAEINRQNQNNDSEQTSANSKIIPKE